MKKYIVEIIPIAFIIFIISTILILSYNNNDNKINNVNLNVVEFGYDNHDYILVETNNESRTTTGIVHNPNCHCYDSIINKNNNRKYKIKTEKL